MPDTTTRDIVVIGSSLGGIAALSELAAQLTPDLPAAVFIAQHVAADSPAELSRILARAGALPAVTAEDGMAIETGRIYVAPPDRHMLLTPAGVRVVFGPRENRSRPAVDPLFRTAAAYYRNRVVGLILTGLQDDGASGLLAVRRCGGIAVVQAPDDAEHSEMPRRALETVEAHHQAPLAGIGDLIGQLVRESPAEPPPVPEAILLEARLTEKAMGIEDWHALPGAPTTFTCPDCAGPIREIEPAPTRRYRCAVGHAFSAEAMINGQEHAVEEALWVALQTLRERARMLEVMARDERALGRVRSADAFDARARETTRHEAAIRALLARDAGEAGGTGPIPVG